MLFFGISLLTMSCERVINVNIQEKPRQVVVEGALTDEGTCIVRISQTNHIRENISLDGINNAKVSITENDRNVIWLPETTVKGIYRVNFTGHSGSTYKLRVECDVPEQQPDGSIITHPKVYTATSKMPQKVELEELNVTEKIFLGRNRIIATVRYTDPPDLGNAYRFIQYVDGKEEPTLFIAKDDLTNARSVVTELLIFDNSHTLKKCDQLRVVLQSIDKPNYLYWYSLNQSALGSSQAASPGNPVSNIEGGALGYFSAHTVSEKNIAVFPDESCSYPN